MNSLFRRKLVSAQPQAKAEGPELKRVLTSFDLTMNGVAAIIGAGIFVLIGTVATQYSGPGIWLSFVLSGLACACVAFAYAELAGMIPSAGSAYEYSYATLGEAPAFIMGWSILLAYGIGTSAVAVGLAGYLAAMLVPWGVTVPNSIVAAPDLMTAVGTLVGSLTALGGGMKLWLTWNGAGPLRRGITSLVTAGGAVLLALSISGMQSFNLVAMAAIALLTWHQYHGVKESVRFTTIMSVVETALVVLFIVLTLGRVQSVNLAPLAPFGWSGIVSGAALIFFAYIGFDSITTMAEECKDPKKDMPRGILWSLAICTVLYILTGLGMVGAVSYLSLDANAPLADVLSKLGYGWLVSIFSLAVLISIKSTLSVLLFAQSRIVMRMSMDGLLPKSLATVGARRQTPYVAILAVGVISAVAAGLFPIAKLAELVNIGVLFAFVAVCVGVIVLRYTHPNMPRSFRSPLVPWLPAVGGIASLIMMLSLSAITWLLFAGWTLVGIAVYMFWGRKNSKLNDAL